MWLFADVFSGTIFKQERVWGVPAVSHQLALLQVWPQPMALGSSPGVHIVPGAGSLQHTPPSWKGQTCLLQAGPQRHPSADFQNQNGAQIGLLKYLIGSSEYFQILSGINYHTVCFQDFSQRRIHWRFCGHCRKKKKYSTVFVAGHNTAVAKCQSLQKHFSSESRSSTFTCALPGAWENCLLLLDTQPREQQNTNITLTIL